MATLYDAVSHMLHGALMADLATWLCTAWFDLRTNRWSVAFELVGFIILTNVMLHTDYLELPSDEASVGVAFLAFTLFFVVKGTLALVHRLHGDQIH